MADVAAGASPAVERRSSPHGRGDAVRNRLGRSLALPSGRRLARASAFTLVELIVVITVIVIILALAVPGFSSMQRDARQTAAYQNINGILTRAYTLALADRGMTAVRFFPGEWDAIEDNARPKELGRQHMAIYRYIGTMVQESGILSPTEYFERAKDMNSVALPEDVWAAPLDALATQKHGRTNYGREKVLPGTIGWFVFDPNNNTTFLNADDFLVVCDGESGVRSGEPEPFRLRAVVPATDDNVYPYEASVDDFNVPYQRYAYSGVVTYHREPFVELGLEGANLPAQRQDFLRQTGRPYLVHRYSGSLLEGAQRPK